MPRNPRPKAEANKGGDGAGPARTRAAAPRMRARRSASLRLTLSQKITRVGYTSVSTGSPRELNGIRKHQTLLAL